MIDKWRKQHPCCWHIKNNWLFFLFITIIMTNLNKIYLPNRMIRSAACSVRRPSRTICCLSFSKSGFALGSDGLENKSPISSWRAGGAGIVVQFLSVVFSYFYLKKKEINITIECVSLFLPEFRCFCTHGTIETMSIRIDVRTINNIWGSRYICGLFC
jgi:hypothetical protein